MDAQIFGILQRVEAETDAARQAELKEEYAGLLGEHFSRNHADFQELAWDMYNVAFRDVVDGYWSTPGATDLVATLVETKTVGLAETDFIEEDLRGMKAYVQGKGGQIHSYIIRAERQQMPREEMVAAIDIHQDEIETNFWGMLGDLQTQAVEKMRTLPVQQILSLVQQAITSGSTFGSFAAAALSDTQIDPILDAVAERSGGQASIVGTLSAIRKLANVGLDFGMAIQQRIFESGVIAQYKGYPVVQLANFEDFEGKFVLPNDELYILGKNCGRVTYYGNTAKVQVLQQPSFYRRWETARDVGFSVYGAAKGRIGRVVLT